MFNAQFFHSLDTGAAFEADIFVKPLYQMKDDEFTEFVLGCPMGHSEVSGFDAVTVAHYKPQKRMAVDI